MNEPGIRNINAVVLAGLAYQAVLVAFAFHSAGSGCSRCYAARLSVLSFLTPLFGMVFGVVFLSEPLSAHFQHSRRSSSRRGLRW